MTDESEVPRTDSRPARRWATLIGSIIGVAGLVAVATTLEADFGATLELFGDLDPTLLLAAIPAAVLSKGMIGAAWRSVLVALGSRPALRAVLRWYYLGSMGKYLPGGVWPVVGRGELAASSGIPRAIAYPSVALSMMLTFMGAALMAVVALPWALRSGAAQGGEVFGSALWSLLVLPVGVILLHPAMGGRALRWGIARFRRGQTDDPREVTLPDTRTLAGLVLVHVPVWFLIGVTQLWVTWVAVEAAALPSPNIGAVIAATSLAWLGGFLALPVPSGIGVREAIFVAALPGVPAEVGLGIALLCRVVFVLGDALAAAGALLLRDPPAT